MNFERGGNIIKNLDIGLNAFPSPGRKFFVRFRLRESRPEYYPLQKMEREGQPIIVICLGINTQTEIAECQIPGIDFTFMAYKKFGEWIIE